jgi:hypothetical protein
VRSPSFQSSRLIWENERAAIALNVRKLSNIDHDSETGNGRPTRLLALRCLMGRLAFHVFHCHRRFMTGSLRFRPPTLTSFNKYRKVSNIDQRVTMPDRHTAAITAPSRHPSVTESSVVLPPDLTGGICCPIHKRPIYRLAWRSGLVVPNASRAWRSSILAQHVPGSSTGPCGAPSAGLSTRLR